MRAERAAEFARLARAFRCSMAEVRAMSMRDIAAMVAILEDEAREAAQQAARANARQGLRGAR